MHPQLELILQSVRPIIGRDGLMSAPSSPKIHYFDNGKNNEEIYRNSKCIRRTKSTEDLMKKHHMTADEMRRFYSRGRRPSEKRHDSFGSTGSTASNGSLDETINCSRNGSPYSKSIDSTPDSVRSSFGSSGSSREGSSSSGSWFRRENDATSPSLSRQHSIDESDIFYENIRQDCKDYRIRLVFIWYFLLYYAF